MGTPTIRTAPPGMRWEADRVGYSLRDSDGQRRAILLPLTPRAWNGFMRWEVDAPGLPPRQFESDLDAAARLAAAHI